VSPLYPKRDFGNLELEVGLAHLENYVNELIAKIKPTTPAKTHIEVPLPALKFHPVDWLSSQVIYPQFYWQSRDSAEEVIALGQVATFIELAPAYLMLQPTQRIWGGRAFEYDNPQRNRCLKSFYFLPQIELTRRGEQWCLSVNVANDPTLTIHALRQLKFEFKPLESLSTELQSLEHIPNKVQWHATVEKALDDIKHTELQKVVLARETSVKLADNISAYQLLKTSLDNNPYSYHFLFSVDENQQFIGASPECLYRRNGLDIQTEALAGTIGRGNSATQDMELSHWLVNDSKNLNENQLVVDDIAQRLAPYCQNVEIQKEAKLLKLRRVQHLKRHIEARLNADVPKFVVLDALQPTAAVAGLPRESAMQFIAENEHFFRGWYSGSVGYISLQQAEFSVAIRSALFINGKIKLFTGAGIVTGSNPEHEWHELDKKMSTLLSLFAESSSLEVAS
jgi:menaquinone-specific isochorismate synthase